MNYKKLIAGVMAVTLMGSGTVLPPNAVKTISDSFVMNAEAAAYSYGYWEYSVLDDGTIRIDNYNGSDAEVTIPSTINGKAVTVIGRNTFLNNVTITKVVISEGVTTINNSFCECPNLEKVIIPSSLTEIGLGAFGFCDNLSSIEIDKNNNAFIIKDGVMFSKDMTRLIKYFSNSTRIEYTIPEGVTTIGYNAFNMCNSLKSVVLPNSVEIINMYAFYNCYNLTSVTIPASVTSISGNAFFGSDSAKIYAESGSYAETYAEENNMMPTFTYGDYECSLAPCGTIRISKYNGSAAEVTIPSTINGKAVTIIDEYVFYQNDKITKVVIPEGVTTINNSILHCQNLEKVIIPSSLTEIGLSEFGFCDNLSSIEIDKNNNAFIIKDGVMFSKDMTRLIKYFSNSTRIEYTIPEGVTSIDYDAFHMCSSLKSVVLPNSVEKINIYAFYHCGNLTSVTIPASVTYISEDAFLGSNSAKIYAESGSYAETYAEENNMMPTFTYGDYECSLASGGTVRIDKYNGSDAEVIIPSTIDGKAVTAIRKWAFAEWDYKGNPSEDNCNLKSVVIPEGVTEIGDNAFEGCLKLTNIKLPESLTKIGVYAFELCRGLSEIKIPDNVSEIGAGAFYRCYSLKEVTIPGNITKIKGGVFGSCSSLKYITIPPSVTEIYDNAFESCPQIIFASVEKDSYADKYASNKSGLVSVYTAGDYQYAVEADKTAITVMKYLGSDTDVKIPSVIDGKPVMGVGYRAFADCTAIKSVTIPDGVTAIGKEAFMNCRILSAVIVPDSVTMIYDDAFKNSSLVKIFANKGSYAESYAIEHYMVPTYTYGDYDYSILVDGTICIEYYNGSDKIVTVPSTIYGIPVTAIGNAAFGLSKVTKVTIPDGVTKIDSLAFSNCPNLSKVIIPTSVKSFGDSVFSATTNVTIYTSSLDVKNYAKANNIPCLDIDKNFAYTILSDSTIRVDEYFGTNTEIVIPSKILNMKVSALGDDLFKNNNSITKVTIPEGVKTIGANAFYYCQALTDVNIPSTVTSIGKNAFTLCGNLTELTLPASVSDIGFGAFSGCIGLKTVTIPDGVKSIGSNAFALCLGLEKIYIPSSVTSIGDGAFSNCSSVVIICDEGSYAETYAKNNKIPYSTATSGTTVNISCPANMTEEITVQFIRKSDGQVEKQEVVTPSNGSAQVLAAGLTGDYIVTFSSETYTANSVRLSISSESKTVAVTMAPCPVVASASLTLDGTIGVNIKAEIPDEFANCQAVLYYDGKTTATKSVKVSSVTKDSNGRYVFTFSVAAKEIADKVSFEIYDANNQKIKIVKGKDKTPIADNSFQYAAMDYINSKKSSSDTELAALCNALSDFGNASRIVFDYNAEEAKIEQSLSGVTAAILKPYEYVRDADCVDGIKISSASLIIESETTINIKFKTTKSSISGYTFTCDGKNVTPAKIAEGEYQVQVTNISAADLDKAHTFSVSDGKNTQKITYSALSYAYSKMNSTDTNLSNVVKTLYLYNKAAKIYLGK